MKKNLNLLLISLFASIALAGTLTACSGGSSESSNDSGSMGGGNSIETPVEDVKITISGSATVTEFEKTTLVAEVTGSDESVVWTSSDTTIATVENGVVTALKAGSVVITASIGDTSETHNLTVEPTTLSHELNFSVSSLAMFEGESGGVNVSVKYKGQTLDNTAYGIKYTWTLINGDAETATMSFSEDGASLTVTGKNAGSVIYRVSTTVRGYEVSKEYVINVYEAIKELGFENNKFSPAEGGYNLDLSLGSLESEQLTIGNVVFVINGEPTANVANVVWQSDDSETVVVEDGVIKALKAGNATLTATATYEGETLSVIVVVNVAKKQVELTQKMMIEAVSETITLPEEIEESVIEKVTINTDNVVYDRAAQIGSADGKVVAVSKAAMPSKMADLGLGKTMTVETDRAVYTMPVDVYTMVISNRDELDRWQSVAAENAVKAGLCLEVQKGFVLSGYFVMDNDVAYNKQWTVYKDFSALWRLSTDKGNPDAVNLKDADGNFLSGVVDEAWNHGINGGFQGIFDGMGHNISGMEVVGKFNGFIVVNGKKGVVQNISFTDAKLGEETSLVVSTGQGTVKNVYMEIDSFAENVITFYRSSAAAIRTVEQVLIDVTDCKLTSLSAGWIGSQCDLNSYKGVYVIGVGNNLQDKLFENTKNSTDIGGFASMEELLLDGTHGAIVKNWDKSFWQIGEKYVLPKDLVSAYSGEITFASAETALNLGSEIILTTDKDAKYIVYSLKQAVPGVSLNGNVLSASSTAASGATVTVVATSLIDGKTAEFTVEITSPLEQVSVNEKFYAETVTNSVLLKYDGFKVGNTYTVTVNGAATTATVETDGQLLATAQGLTAGNTYSVECKDNKGLITFTNVFAATQILKTAEDLNVLNGGKASANISGYYILGGDINCEDALYEAGTYNNKQFTGIFDGNGYTISNIKAGSCGIFGVLNAATVRNVNFTGVSIAPSHAADANYGNYAALLAGKALNSTTIENVNVTFKEIQWPFPQGYTDNSVTGVLVARFDDHMNFIKNVTIDATGLTITNALGCTMSAVTYQNVKVLADDVVLIACTGNDSKSDIGEWPTGVTYVDTLTEVEIKEAVSALGGEMTLVCDLFEVGEVYTVESGLISVTATVEEAGKLSVKLEGVGIGTISVNCKTTGKEIIFSNVKSEAVVQIEEITVTAKCYADGGAVTLESENFVEGESYNVTCGAAAAVATVTETGKLTATLTGIAVGEILTVTCASNTKIITFTNVLSATKVLKTASDLNVLNATAAGAKLTGYYVLGDNIDCADALYEAKKYDGNNVFSGVLDGQGYTISNIKVGACGILGTLVDGTVKNVNFTGVSIAPSHAADANYGNYCAVLAGSTWGKTTIENVNVSFKEIQWPFPQGYTDNSVTGLLVARFNSAAVVVKDVTIDATGLTVSCALGCTISAVQYENVKILADAVTVIGATDNNMTSRLTEWPVGVTYTCTKAADAVDVTAPDESDYYTFSGEKSATVGKSYTFTVTEKVSSLNAVAVFVNGEEITGDNGTYTVANVTEALEIKVIHGYIQHGNVSSVSYNENGVAMVTNSTSTSEPVYIAYISADYVNYLLSKGYTHWDFNIKPDGTIANQAIVGCGNTIVRTVDIGDTSIARVQLKADTAIKFWCQKDGSGSKIQGQGSYMTVTYGQPSFVNA